MKNRWAMVQGLHSVNTQNPTIPFFKTKEEVIDGSFKAKQALNSQSL